jgi:putative tryptophan/tyrosine transport system substrate-binding protein
MDRTEFFALTTGVRRATLLPDVIALCDEVERLARRGERERLGELILKASRERDIDTAFTSFVEQNVNAVVVGTDAFFLSRRDQLVGLAARHALPRAFVRAAATWND